MHAVNICVWLKRELELIVGEGGEAKGKWDGNLREQTIRDEDCLE